MPPDLYCERWRVYTPYDVRVWLEPGMMVKFYLGMGFYVPDGFVLYMFLNEMFIGQLEIEEMFITPGDRDDVVLTVRALKSFYLRKYMNVANFIILPVLNTQDTRGLMCVPHTNEYR